MRRKNGSRARSCSTRSCVSAPGMRCSYSSCSAASATQTGFSHSAENTRPVSSSDASDWSARSCICCHRSTSVGHAPRQSSSLRVKKAACITASSSVCAVPSGAVNWRLNPPGSDRANFHATVRHAASRMRVARSTDGGSAWKIVVASSAYRRASSIAPATTFQPSVDGSARYRVDSRRTACCCSHVTTRRAAASPPGSSTIELRRAPRWKCVSNQPERAPAS